MIEVVLADDQVLVRAGFRALLDAQSDIAVVGEAGTGREALALVRTSHPDIVLMDIRMPDLDGIGATQQIVADPGCSGVRIIVLTTFELDEYVFDALRAGASGFLVKDTEPTELLRGIRAVHRGEALLSPSVTRRLIEEFASKSKIPNPRYQHLLDDLTDRERELMSLAAKGMTNDSIAAALFISPATVKTHLSRAMQKLGARDRAQLVVIAYETGMVRPGWSDDSGETHMAPQEE